MHRIAYSNLLSRITRGVGPLGDVLGEAQMYALIDFERERANRGGPPFALVAFESRRGGRGVLRRLVRPLRQRVRRIDVLGWMDGGLTLLLPATDAEGARVLANDTLLRLTGYGELSYRVLAYPDEGSRRAASSGRTGRIAAAAGSEAGSPAGLGEGQGAGERGTAPGLADALDGPPVPGWKRVLDVLGALALLPLALPLMAAGAWLVQRRDPGPILFRQERIGHRGRPFRLYKLRTMRAYADQGRHRDHLRALMRANVPLTKLDRDGDDRVVPGTAWMRRTGVDELPQLFNVLLGHMSLVGPRPCLAYEAEALARWQRGRFKVPPGLTGLWQVNGKNRTTFRRMLELDVRYANGPSLLGDLGILVATPFAVLTAAGQ